MFRAAGFHKRIVLSITNRTMFQKIEAMNCLVTGAASGLGLATAKMLFDVDSRNRLALLDITSDPPSDFSRFDDRFHWFQVDITDDNSLSSVFDKIKTQFGYLNVVVNCAGISLTERVYEPKINRLHSLETFQRIMNINVIGTFNVIRLSSALMIASPSLDQQNDGYKGVIVNVSSITATDGQARQCGYAASKGAVSAMTLPLARELGEFGIRVCALCPGMMMTPMVEKAVSQEMGDFIRQHSAFPKRAGTPEEFAEAVKSIIGNKFLNGVNIRLDAGLRL